jgi:intracellular sulfur oxidation DsrE/DsrF family protein
MAILKESVNIVLSVVLLMLSTFSTAQEQFRHSSVDTLISNNVEPEGVVFEILEWRDNTWKWASPMIKSLRNQLQNKYPELEIAIVSHGDEQFELTKNRESQQPQAINILNDMVMNGVSLHVCGVNSGWNNVGDDEYIDIVDVAVSGPAKINDYIMLGYEHILIQNKIE